MSAVKLKELVRILQNDLNYSVATLNGDNYVETQAMPEGTANAPFLYRGYGQFDYLKIPSKLLLLLYLFLTLLVYQGQPL